MFWIADVEGTKKEKNSATFWNSNLDWVDQMVKLNIAIGKFTRG